jgi:hypothetical protein
MSTALKLVSYAGLGLTVAPSFLVFGGVLSADTFKVVVLVGSLLWLGTAPFWINRDRAGKP